MQRGCPKHFEVARNDGEDILGNLGSLGNLGRTFASALNSLISLKTHRHATIGQSVDW